MNGLLDTLDKTLQITKEKMLVKYIVKNMFEYIPIQKLSARELSNGYYLDSDQGFRNM